MLHGSPLTTGWKGHEKSNIMRTVVIPSKHRGNQPENTSPSVNTFDATPKLQNSGKKLTNRSHAGDKWKPPQTAGCQPF